MPYYKNPDTFGDPIFDLSPLLLDTLLRDNTLSTSERQTNIFWGTDTYAHLGRGFKHGDPITRECFTGSNSKVLIPRSLKSGDIRFDRTRRMAEVFTPAWLCNKQNNMADKARFGRDDVFNVEIDSADGTHSWRVNPERVSFPDGKNWQWYVGLKCLEVTCGEAPYLVSRHDASTGLPIAVGERIGILDRKLRVTGENTSDVDLWYKGALTAYRSTYGYEWHGDSLLLARIALLLTFSDYFKAKFGRQPELSMLLEIADVISWNLWQMDGLKGVVPDTCGERRSVETDLFGQTTETVCPCEGCRKDDMSRHNGVYALIRDWETGRTLRYADLIANRPKEI